MLQVSRSNNLKIPKKVKTIIKEVNNVEDIIEVKKGIAMAENKKINEQKMKDKIIFDEKN